MTDFRQRAMNYINRLIKVEGRRGPNNEIIEVEFGSFLNWGTVGEREALYFRNTLTKKKIVIVDGNDDEFEEVSFKEFVPNQVDFHHFFETKMGGVSSGMIVVLSQGTYKERPAVHALNVEYGHDLVWTPSADWPIEFKMESHTPDENYVIEKYTNRLTKWIVKNIAKS